MDEHKLIRVRVDCDRLDSGQVVVRAFIPCTEEYSSQFLVPVESLQEPSLTAKDTEEALRSLFGEEDLLRDLLRSELRRYEELRQGSVELADFMRFAPTDQEARAFQELGRILDKHEKERGAEVIEDGYISEEDHLLEKVKALEKENADLKEWKLKLGRDYAREQDRALDEARRYEDLRLEVDKLLEEQINHLPSAPLYRAAHRVRQSIGKHKKERRAERIPAEKDLGAKAAGFWPARSGDGCAAYVAEDADISEKETPLPDTHYSAGDIVRLETGDKEFELLSLYRRDTDARSYFEVWVYRSMGDAVHPFIRVRPHTCPVVARIENGQRVPTLHSIKHLAEAHGYSYVYGDEPYHGGMIQVDMDDREVFVVGDPSPEQRLEFEKRWSIDV